MKTLLYIILFNISAISFAQDPQLFENDWYLHKIIINEVDFFPPGTNGEAAIIKFIIDENNIGSTVCDTRGADITAFDDINNTFSVGIFVSLGEECIYTENQIFEDRYFNDFFKWTESSNIYQYQIDTGSNNSKTLTLSNSDNNIAIYGNEPLDVQNFKNSKFLIYPNPVKESLVLNSTNRTGKLNLKIFTTEGKLIRRQNLEYLNQVSIDISNLSSGIYFLNIEDGNGNVEVRKFIKE